MKNILYILLFFSCAAWGQTAKVYGNITDTTNETLPFVNIELKSSTLNNQITTSDVDGNFVFTNLIEGKYQLIVKYVGCQKTDTTIKINNNDSLRLKLTLICRGIICTEYTLVEVNAKVAEQEIKKGRPRLLLSSGYSSVIYVGQEIFEEKYKVKYHDYGCVAPTKEEILEYNKVIFNYLDKKYGKKWRKEVRKDVVGLR